MQRLEAVKWKGETYVLVPSLFGRGGGAIATVDQCENGYMSTAYLFEDGEIWQRGACVGSRADLEWAGTIDVEIKPHAPLSLLLELDKLDWS